MLLLVNHILLIGLDVMVMFEIDMRMNDHLSTEYPFTVLNFGPSWTGWGLELADSDGDGIWNGSTTFPINTTFHYQIAVTGASDQWSGWGKVLAPPTGCTPTYSASIGSESMTVKVCAGTRAPICPIIDPATFKATTHNSSSISCERWHAWSASRGLLALDMDAVTFCRSSLDAWASCSGIGDAFRASATGGALTVTQAALGPRMFGTNLIRPFNGTGEPRIALSSQRHPVPPRNFRAPKPYPTNIWWATLGVGDGSGPFTSLPYTLESTTTGLKTCVPRLETCARQAELSCASSVRLIIGGEGINGTHDIVSFDDLSVTIEYRSAEGCVAGCGSVSFPILHGMPYVSANFTTAGMRPRISIENSALLGVDDDYASASQALVKTGGSADGRVLLRFANGELWAIFWDGAANFTWTHTGLQFTSPVSGWLRAAATAPPASPGTNGTGLNQLCALDTHSGLVPTAGDLSASRIADSTEVLIQFSWHVDRMARTPSEADHDALLLMTLPHHREQLRHDSPPPTDEWYTTHRGVLSPLLASNWTLVVSLDMGSGSMNHTFTNRSLEPPWSFEVPLTNCSQKEEVFWALQDEATFDPGQWPGSVYWGGKGWWKLARLVLLAAEFEDGALEAQLHSTLRTRLTEALSPDGPLASTHRFVYEPEWGGVMHNGSMSDFMTDFGAGWCGMRVHLCALCRQSHPLSCWHAHRYNDHHFHYGYVWYAAAVVARRDPAWIAEWGEYVQLLVRDVLSPVADAWFPSFRSMDWWLGHSSAGGTFRGEKNQESTSEAAGAYYACHLWGIASSDDHVRDLCFVLQAVETASSRRYWQMTANDTTIPLPFAERKVVGIMWGHKAVYDTWFSQAAEHIHLIQFLPISPASVALLPASWVVEQWPALQQQLGTMAEQDWPDLVLSNQAILEPEAAWAGTLALDRGRFGSGTSRADSLWWAATRPSLASVAAGQVCERTFTRWSCEPGACCASELRVASHVSAASSGFWRGRERLAVPMSRGMTVAIANGATLQLKAFVTFDTYASPAEAIALTTFLEVNASDAGDVVLLSAVDDASTQLSSAIPALQALGAQLVSNIGFRDSYAAILIRGVGAISERTAAVTESAVTVAVSMLCNGTWYVEPDSPAAPPIPFAPPLPSWPSGSCSAIEVGQAGTAISSSHENQEHLASMANDGLLSTRWSSAPTDDEWIFIDLKGIWLIQRVELVWEGAFAESYTVVSNGFT